MIFVALKLIAVVGILYLAYILVQSEQRKRFYEKQGVKFAGPLSVVMDTVRVIVQAAANRHDLPIVPSIKKALNVDHLPSHAGVCIVGEVILLFNDPDALQDIYVNKNAAFTKHEVERKFGLPLLYNNIVSMETDDP